MMKDILLDRIKNRTAKVGVVGRGYVGLPLAVEFAKAGFHVVGYDVSERVVNALNAGRSHVQDVSGADLAAGVGGGQRGAPPPQGGPPPGAPRCNPRPPPV
jgi:UDP-N-acetyl-D-glucosamine dehydrogenase